MKKAGLTGEISHTHTHCVCEDREGGGGGGGEGGGRGEEGYYIYQGPSTFLPVNILISGQYCLYRH